MIDGVQLVPRTRHADDRGYVTEVLRSDEDHFRKFGQAYVTACYPGVVKAWHRHGRQIDYFFAVSGTVEVGLYDERDHAENRHSPLDHREGQHPAPVQEIPQQCGVLIFHFDPPSCS